MKKLNFLIATLLALVSYSNIQAEDIDLYSGSTSTAGKPNILIVFDNAANFSASNTSADSTCTIGGSTNTLSGTQGGIEQCVFYNVVNNLPVNTVNIGMMVYNANNIKNYLNSPSGECQGSNGGCLAFPIMPMDASNKTTLLNWIKSWQTSNGGAGTSWIKANGQQTAATLQEAWAYYYGSTGLSGTSYSGTKPTAGCQHNFVVFIANATDNNGTPADGGSASPKTALLNAPGITTYLSTPIIKTMSTQCGSFTFPSGATHESQGYYADEWTRYMNRTDLYSTVNGSQGITTYTIGVLGAQCKAEYAATLESMAEQGGGKFYATSDAASLTKALLDILNEVQATNSAFSAASLPVSVTAQGTYLNQLYMGMFRPEATANPRWVGNLKQYKFIQKINNATNQVEIELGDSVSASAISSAGTGFLAPSAISYWTCTKKDTYPYTSSNTSYAAVSSTAWSSVTDCPLVSGTNTISDPASGFWANSTVMGQGLEYDLPDGEIVEKGGAAQIMRLAYLYADYTATPGSSSNPRKLYTYCPSGTNCQSSLSHSDNVFDKSNSLITASMFGGTSSVAVSSIVRSGSSATVTTSSTHGFSNGTMIAISGANQSEYNNTWQISGSSGNQFTITGIPDYPNTPNLIAYTANSSSAGNVAISSITRSGSVTYTSGVGTDTATVTTSSNHGYITGNQVNISGANETEYNGLKTITKISNTQFSYPVTVLPTSPATNSYQAIISSYTKTISTITRSGTNATITTNSAHGFHDGQIITISGTSVADYNGSWTISQIVSSTQFKISVSNTFSTPSSGGLAATSATPVSLSSVQRSAANTASAGAPSKVFANGDTLVISVQSGTAANESTYAKTATITCTTTCTTFTYPITETPANSATGTMTASMASSPITISAGKITRSNTTATVTNVTNSFNTGDTITISPATAALSSESSYIGTWTITCPVDCSTSFTFGPVALSPASPATGSIVAQNNSAPNRTLLMDWVRGSNNAGDEFTPSSNISGQAITIRPSLHGDVLHSRPIAVNYGGTIGVIAFYGANDGVYRAVNANQTNPTGTSLPIPGSELWGFIPSEFFGELNRLRTNIPKLYMPGNTSSGVLPAPTRKDYFVDGTTGLYQTFNSNGTTNKAYIYLSMRRGGRFIYAMDVSTPTSPQIMWKFSSADDAELGQTWSLPKVAFVDGYNDNAGKPKPVLIFAAGYDPAADSDQANSMGRGIFILDATTGSVIWKAVKGTSTGRTTAAGVIPATYTHASLDYSLPADITLLDRDGNGRIDRLYATDVGGNVWRVDLNPGGNSTADNWQITHFASLGCAGTGGACSGNIPRKFFYPADVITSSSGDRLVLGQGDRENPTAYDNSTTHRSRIFMLIDKNIGNDGRYNPGTTNTVTPITIDHLIGLTTVTSTTNQLSMNYTGGYSTTTTATAQIGSSPNLGFYITLEDGEKAINSPLYVGGYAYIGTNTPKQASATECANLGLARGYKISLDTGSFSNFVVDGGGLVQSSQSGTTTVQTTSGTLPISFMTGATDQDGDGKSQSALQGGKVNATPPTKRNRTYWYQKIDK